MKNIIMLVCLCLFASLFTGCGSINSAVTNMRGKAVSIQGVIDGVDITMTETESASATPRVKAGHMQHDYTGVPVMQGQPIQIIKRNYSLFFGQLMSEIQITVMAPDDKIIKFNQGLLELEAAKPIGAKQANAPRSEQKE